MQKIILNNGVRLLYKFKDIEHTSFCISLESGANAENKDEIGMAHALEHILFKGNEKLKEDEINEKLDDEPEYINEDPYDAWIVKVKVSDEDELDNLLNSDSYESSIE